MTRLLMTRLFAILAFAFAGLAFAASPTVDQVYQATKAGRIAEAEAMMQQVLAEHPDSASAHFVSAEVEYRAGHLDRARTEFATAEQLSPGLPKVSPRAVAELRAGLASGGMVRSSLVNRAGNGGMSPMVLFLLVLGAVLLVVWLIRRNRQPTVIAGGYGPNGGMGGAAPMGGPTPMGGPGYGYGYGAGGPGVMGQGSGIMGSVASGLAVGAGIVAGEALARRVFEPGHPNYVDPGQDTYVDPNADLGGNDFGTSGGWDDGGGFSGGGGDDWS